MSSKKTSEWKSYGQKLTRRLVELARKSKELSSQGPEASSWWMDLEIVGKAQILKLNREYRGVSKETDVLSFLALPPFRDQGMLGELVVCLPVLKNQARRHHIEPETELKVLLVHGFLHLLGFDHEKGAKSAEIMRSWETQLLKKILTQKELKKGVGLIERSQVGPTTVGKKNVRRKK